MELTKETIKKIVKLMIIAGIILWVALNYKTALWLLASIISLFRPIIIGVGLAFIVNVLLRLIEEKLFIYIDRAAKGKKRMARVWNALRRPLSMLLSVVLIIALIIAVILLVIPELRNTISVLIDEFPGYLDRIQTWIESFLLAVGASPEKVIGDLIDWDNVLDKVNKLLVNDEGSAFNSAVGITAGVFSGIANAVLGIVFAMYILGNKEKLADQFKSLFLAYLPKDKAMEIIAIGKLSNRMFSGFVVGQFTDACLFGVLTFIGMTILKFPYAMMISILIGFTALIPIVGAFIGVTIGTLLILMQDISMGFAFLAFILILQQIDSALIYPRVVGKSVSLPGIWILLAVLVGGNLAGVVGMLVGVPLGSVIYTLLQRSVRKRLNENEIILEEVEKSIEQIGQE